MFKKIIYLLPMLSPLIYLNIFGFKNIGVVFELVAIMLLLLFTKQIKINKNLIYPITFTVIYILYVVNNNVHHELSFYNGVFWWVILVGLLLLYTNFKLNNINTLRVVHIFFITAILVLSLDAYYRFFINFLTLENIGRYAFKYGLIDIDSNFSGLYGMLCFFSVYIVEKLYHKSFTIYKIIFLFLIILSLSVAAIATTVSYFIWISFRNNIARIFLIYLLFIGLFFIIDFIKLDGSGDSKIQLILYGIDYLSSLSLSSLLFGVGLDQGLLNGTAPHLLILKLIVELGLFGFILYFTMIISFFKILNYNYVHLIIPYFILGFSVVSISSPILTITIILLFIVIQSKESEYA
jgi:hypothetical protein